MNAGTSLRRSLVLHVAAAFAAMASFAPDDARAQGTTPAKRSTAAAAPGADYWSVNTSTGSHYSNTTPQRSRAVERSSGVTTEIHPEFGRVPLQNSPGSVGFTSGQSASSGRFQDGRSVPGLNPNTQKESSFVGMSLTVPSGTKGLPVPLPVAPTPWNRNE